MHGVYEYRRHLPHYQGDHKAIFLTFSTHQRWILPPDARTIVLECCIFENGTRVNLHGAVVMPDHVHLVLTPAYDGNSFFSVAEIMQSIKSVSAHKINHLLTRRGQVWQRESFDRVLRRGRAFPQRLNTFFRTRCERDWFKLQPNIDGCGFRSWQKVRRSCQELLHHLAAARARALAPTLD